MKSTRLILGALSILAMAHGVFAAEMTPEAMKRCAAVTDSLARLVCYDQLASGTPSPAAAPAPKAATAPAAPAAAAAVVTAPVATSKAPSLGDEALKSSDAETATKPTSLTAKITALELVRSSNYYITLDNGQKWLQEEIHTGFHLEVGDTVQILRGKMGGYKLAYVKNGKPVGTWIRVTRKV
jgi:hypothetical protein